MSLVAVRLLPAVLVQREDAARRGTERLNLVVRVRNGAARAFYEKYGFRRLRTLPAYYEDGEDGLAMWRPVRLRKTSG